MIAGMWPDRVRVERNSPVSDGHGGYSPNWVTVIHSYSCRLYSRTGGLARPELGELDLYTHKFQGGIAEVKGGDRFLNLGNGEMLVVVEVETVKMGLTPHHLTGRLNRIPARKR